MSKHLKDQLVEEEFAFIAAQCITGKKNPDPGLINYGLYKHLKEAEDMIQNCFKSYRLTCPQLITILILQYKMMHPDIKLYGE